MISSVWAIQADESVLTDFKVADDAASASSGVVTDNEVDSVFASGKVEDALVLDTFFFQFFEAAGRELRVNGLGDITYGFSVDIGRDDA